MSLVLYTMLGVGDLDRALAFYDAVLATIGHTRRRPPSDGYAAWGPGYDEGTGFHICKPFDKQPASVGNGTMVAFTAANEATVHAFHSTALAHGATDEGGPGPRPHYGPHFYAAYIRDPDGNKLACVFHKHNIAPADTAHPPTKI